jgi:hypothetical protein
VRLSARVVAFAIGFDHHVALQDYLSCPCSRWPGHPLEQWRNGEVPHPPRYWSLACNRERDRTGLRLARIRLQGMCKELFICFVSKLYQI